jgi:hypothetical protein
MSQTVLQRWMGEMRRSILYTPHLVTDGNGEHGAGRLACGCSIRRTRRLRLVAPNRETKS